VLVPAAAVPLRAEGLDVDGGRVSWDDGLDALGRQAARAFPEVRAEVERRLGFAYRGPTVEVVIVRGLDRMQEVTRAQVPAWAVGVAVSSRALIAIRADLLFRGFGGGIVPVLRHEWVHLAWGQHAGARRRTLPLWVEEGIAEDVGGGISIDLGATLDLAVVFDRLLPFDSLETGFPADTSRAALAYKQSESWVRFLTQRVGWQPLQAVLADLASGDAAAVPQTGDSPFARAIRVHTGRSVSEWTAAWRVSLEEAATPWFHLILRDFQGFLIAGLALLGALAFGFVLRRRRRQIARLPDEDPEAP